MLATESPLPQYFDTDGKPLTGGFLYFGLVNQNPETAATSVYWDAAGTQPAAQPIGTINGYAARNGTPAIVYASGDYSLTVKNRKGRVVMSAPSSASNGVALSTLQAALAASTGATLVGDLPAGSGGVPMTLAAALNSLPATFEYFGAVGDGVTDDTTAIQNAISSGRRIISKKATYLVTTVAVSNVANICVDASKATFTSAKWSVFQFTSCNDLYWQGGTINPGTSNAGLTASNWYPFFVTTSSRVIVTGVSVINQGATGNTGSPAPAFTCITFWSVDRGTISNCFTYNGGDNSIWCFYGNDINIVNNVIYGNFKGRAITVQQVHAGSITGNTIANGWGDGISIHGSDNFSVTGNAIYNMAVDALELGTSRGISIEFDENATPTTVTAANVGMYVFNGVYARNIVVSGNTISNVSLAMSFGGKTIGGNFYGNYGVVSVVGNIFENCSQGILLNPGCRGTRIAENTIRDMGQGGILVNFTADYGGYVTSDIHIVRNQLSKCNTQALGYTPIHVLGTYLPANNVLALNNTYDDPALSNAIALLSSRASGNQGLTSVGMIGSANVVDVQAPFGGLTNYNDLATALTIGSCHEFVFTGQLTDAFQTVYAIPSNAAVVAHIQIGSADRLMAIGTLYAHNGTTPASSFVGIGTTYAQISGGNLQLKGNTSGGTANYGGIYTIKIIVMKNT